MRRLASLLLLCTFSTLSGTDLKPWFPRYLEIQSSFTYWHQQYSSVSEGDRSKRWRSQDDFFTVGLEAAYDTLCGELEATLASTKHRHFGADNIRATLRYQILDDILGDTVSLVAGATLSQVFSQALKDVSVFHHGGVEGELHLSVGRESTCQETWSSRWWCVGGVGLGDHGSPWLHGECAWEKNWCDTQFVRLYGIALGGLGGDSLNVKKFDGYGPIAHRSLDFGAMYRYTFPCWGTLSFTYARRLYAKNCPEKTNSYIFCYDYPFGL